MKFMWNDWDEHSDQYVEIVDQTLLAPGRRIGWKIKRGETRMPESLVKELLKEAYIQGAKAALALMEDV